MEHISHTTQSSEQRRAREAADLGLPEDATWEDITKRLSEQHRAREAADLGLPEDATWEDITKHRSEQSRKIGGTALR